MQIILYLKGKWTSILGVMWVSFASLPVKECTLQCKSLRLNLSTNYCVHRFQKLFPESKNVYYYPAGEGKSAHERNEKRNPLNVQKLSHLLVLHIWVHLKHLDKWKSFCWFWPGCKNQILKVILCSSKCS